MQGRHLAKIAQLANSARAIGCALCCVVWLAGCASYSDGLQHSLDLSAEGDYYQAQQILTNALQPEGNDELLYYLELGLLTHLSGDYAESLLLLEQAEQLADSLYTVSLTNSAVALMTNPGKRKYAGSEFERLLINYYKSLNYLKLSLEDPKRSPQRLESARVEIRRLGSQLDQMAAAYGRYKDLAVETDNGGKDARLFSSLMDLFNVLTAGRPAQQELLYREDAYAHWFSGLLYEIQGEWDNARIAYEKAAETYELGYAAQYDLPDGVIEQAWFDTVRVMQRAGGYTDRWPGLAEQKLSAQKRAELAEFSADKAQLVVLQHVGSIPARRELNFYLSVEPRLKSLLMTPVLVGSYQQQRAQAVWFRTLYADNDLLALVKNYAGGGLAGSFTGIDRKLIPLGPLWKTFERSGVLEALQNGVRISVPYYPPVEKQSAASRLYVSDSHQGETLTASSLASIAVQEQIRTAGREIQLALARETVKMLLADQAAEFAEELSGGLGLAAQLFGQLAAVSTAGAETRNWLSLPGEIRIKRVALEPGEYELMLATPWLNNGKTTQQHQSMTLQGGQITVWQQRTTAQLQPLPPSDTASHWITITEQR